MRTLRVGFQGEHGAFSEMAALEFFGKAVQAVPCVTFEGIFSRVDRGDLDYGMLPIENSLAGSIHRNYDLLLQYNLFIVGELKLRVVHNLIVNPGVRFEDLQEIHSHPQALEQCRGFFQTYPELRVVPVYDTAGAVKTVKEQGLKQVGAVASPQAARYYEMEVLHEGIEDNPQNYTRFLVLSRENTLPQGDKTKTSIVFALKNDPGMLFKALSAFALRDIDLCKIESRPLVGIPWDYLFYLDFRGDPQDKECQRALAHLQEIATYFKLLGSYEEGRTVQTPP